MNFFKILLFFRYRELNFYYFTLFTRKFLNPLTFPFIYDINFEVPQKGSIHYDKTQS